MTKVVMIHEFHVLSVDAYGVKETGYREPASLDVQAYSNDWGGGFFRDPFVVENADVNAYRRRSDRERWVQRRNGKIIDEIQRILDDVMTRRPEPRRHVSKCRPMAPVIPSEDRAAVEARRAALRRMLKEKGLEASDD